MTDIDSLLEESLACDVLVIGAEGAGARAALEAARQGASVIAMTKGKSGRSGATLTAGGEISIDSRSATTVLGLDGDLDDSPETFALDMLRAGEFLNDQRLVQVHASEAPYRIKELVEWGAKLEDLVQGPGHAYKRGVWITGLKLARLLSRRMKLAKIPVLEERMALEILTDPDGVTGVLALDIRRGRLELVRCKALVLATGGGMRIFPLVTAPEELTGDGMAMALRCGARLQDMEFPMFLPYTFLTPSALSGNVFPYEVSALMNAHALNRFGERYLQRWDPHNMEHTTRDVNSVAAAVEVLEGRGSLHGGTYLSLSHLPPNLVDFSSEWLPPNRRNWMADGFNLKDFFETPGQEAWEVAPACHFWNGGVHINDRCETGLPGLYAAGEGTAGIHGANRLSGNGLTMTQVWGQRAGKFAGEGAAETKLRPPERDQLQLAVEKFDHLCLPGSGPNPLELRRQIRRTAGELVGIVRSGERLKQAQVEIDRLRSELPHQSARSPQPESNFEWVEALQNENQLDVLEAIVLSSLGRHESRGALYRQDFPEADDDHGLHNQVLGRCCGEWTVHKRPVEAVFASLPVGVRRYGVKPHVASLSENGGQQE